MGDSMTGEPARIVWLASYPKSGNTWLRFFLYALLYGPPESSAAVDRRFPEAGWDLAPAALRPGRNFFKTHWTCDPASLPCWELTECAIYMVRNPLQIVVSSWHYLILRAGNEYLEASQATRQEMFLKHASQFVQSGGAVEWADSSFGSWPQNVASWTSAPVPVLVLCYEDFVADPTAVGTKVAEFLEIDAGREELSVALDASSFKAMKRMEEREIAVGASGFFTHEGFAPAHALGKRFVRAGRTDEFETVFTEDQLTRLRAGFGDQFCRIGYG